MSEFLTLTSQLSTAVDQLNQVLQGDENATVMINGEEKPSVQKKALDEVTARVQLVLDAAADIDAIKYPSTAAGIASGSEYFSVVSDNDESYLDLYKNESDVAVFMKSYPSAAAVDNILLSDISITQFVRPDSETYANLHDELGSTGVPRGQIYRSFRSLRVYGARSGIGAGATKYAVRAVILTDDSFRLIIDGFVNSAWGGFVDTGVVQLSTLAVGRNDFLQHSFTTSGEAVVEVEIDLSLIPNYGYLLNQLGDYDLIITDKSNADKSFDNDKNELITPLIDSKIAENNEVLQSSTISLYDDIISTVWSRYKSDLSALDNAVGSSKRKQIYQCFKNVEFYGLDVDSTVKLNTMWTNAYPDSLNRYRLILHKLIDGAWEVIYDVSKDKPELESLGLEDGKVFRWDFTDPTYDVRLIADIDYTHAVDGFAILVDANEPDLVFSKQCFKSESSVIVDTLDKDVKIVSAAKRRMSSRTRPIFAFQWDDAYSSDDLVFNIFQEYNFPTDFVLSLKYFPPEKYDQYKEYYTKGSSILAHSVTHPNMFTSSTLTDEEAWEEIYNSKATIESLGIKINGWVTPASALKPEWLPLVQKAYAYGFTGMNAGVYDKSLDPCKMARYGMEVAFNTIGLQGLKERVDLAIQQNQLLVFYGHAIPSTTLKPSGEPYMTEQDLRDFLDYVKLKVDNGDCDVMSTDEAVECTYSSIF